MNDFAKSQLMKYGWTEGKGLGKHESGITQAIKPKLKFDTAGVGHRDKDWTNWWESAFNKAANNITIESQAHSVSISVSKECTIDDYLNKSLKEKRSKCSTSYGNFLKTSTLLNGNLIAENNSNACEEPNTKGNIPEFSLTDEELFKICGGRTAHKGARHGLTLNGKLKRIAQQEKDLLDSNLYINVSEELHNNNNMSESDKYEEINDKNAMVPMISTEETMVQKVSKSAKRRNRRRINDLSHQLNVLCNVSDNDERTKCVAREEKEKQSRKRKKENRKNSVSYDIGTKEVDKKSDESFPMNHNLRKAIIKKNVKKQNDHIEKKNIKKKKKNKLKEEKNQDINMWIDKELIDSQAKKFKKSHKCDSDLQQSIQAKDVNTLEYKSQPKLPCNKVHVGFHKGTDLSPYEAEYLSQLADLHFKNKADYLNKKIMKKKKAKLRKKERIKLNKIAESLGALHFNNEEPVSNKGTKKQLKTVIKKMMATNIMIDKVEHLKKSRKKGKEK